MSPGVSSRASTTRLAHRGVFAQHRFDLAQLDPEAADLHLIIEPAQKLEVAIGQVAHPIPRAIHPRPAHLRERVRQKLLRGQLGPVQIAARHTIATDVQLARHPDGTGLSVPIQHVERVCSRSADPIAGLDGQDPAIRLTKRRSDDVVSVGP